MKKIIFRILVIGLVGIQFFQPGKNIAATKSESAIELHYEIPATVQLTLKSACYDCHSDNTAYPWYFNLQPAAWFLNSHIQNGKRHLNFDHFYEYTPKKQRHKLEELVDMLRKAEMPLKSYTLLHPEARLNSKQKQEIMDWAQKLSGGIPE